MGKRVGKSVKWTAAEIEDIYATIDCGLAYGLPTEAIATDLLDTFYLMSRPMAVSYINERRRRIVTSKAQLSVEEDLNRGIQILRYENIYALAMQRGDLRSALAAAKELGAVHGLMERDSPPKQSRSRTVHVEQMNVMGIPEDVLKGLEPTSDQQLELSWINKEFTEEQAKFLVDQSRGVDTTGGDE